MDGKTPLKNKDYKLVYNVIMGAPGSGKTTFGSNKCQGNSNYIVISCGDLYRNYHKLLKYQFLQIAKEESKESWVLALQEFIILALIDEIDKKLSEFTDGTGDHVNFKMNNKGETMTVKLFIDGLWIDNIIPFQEKIGKINKLYYIRCDKDTSMRRLIDRGRPQDSRNLKSRIINYYNREPEVLNILDKLSSDINVIFI